MDTRSKILSLAEAERLPAPLVVAAGHFDVLGVEHARELERVRNRTAGSRLLVAVLPHTGELLNTRARAEMAAALRMVDYVVTADDKALDRLIERLKPAEVVRLEQTDLRRTRRLIEHVQRGQTR